MHPTHSDIGHSYKANIQSHAPAANAAGTRDGTAVDVSAYGSGTLVANLGATDGTPTSFSVTYALETSANGTTGWTALKDVEDNAVTLAVTTASTTAEKDFSLQYVPQAHRYIRAVETVAFVDGTTPTVLSGATFVLGGGQTYPL